MRFQFRRPKQRSNVLSDYVNTHVLYTQPLLPALTCWKGSGWQVRRLMRAGTPSSMGNTAPPKPWGLYTWWERQTHGLNDHAIAGAGVQSVGLYDVGPSRRLVRSGLWELVSLCGHGQPRGASSMPCGLVPSTSSAR